MGGSEHKQGHFLAQVAIAMSGVSFGLKRFTAHKLHMTLLYCLGDCGRHKIEGTRAYLPVGTVAVLQGPADASHKHSLDIARRFWYDQ